MIRCPECSAPWVVPSHVEIHPEPGDATVCAACGRVLRFARRLFGADLYLKPLSPHDERVLRRKVREYLNDLQARQ